ncbi:MAG: HAD family phosphatase [Clostridia bacterium]
MKRKNKFVVFDMDGVLFDTELLMIRCWEQVAEKYAIPDIVTTCRRCIGINRVETNRIFQDRYGTLFDVEKMRQEVDESFENELNTHGMPQKPHAESLLRFLNSAGFHIALATSTVSQQARFELEQANFLQNFEVIIGGEMVAKSKPAPDIFLTACQNLGSSPEETYVIEDSLNGIRAAYAANTIPLMVPDLIEPSAEIRSLCHAVFSDLSEVKNFFKKSICL